MLFQLMFNKCINIIWIPKIILEFMNYIIDNINFDRKYLNICFWTSSLPITENIIISSNSRSSKHLFSKTQTSLFWRLKKKQDKYEYMRLFGSIIRILFKTCLTSVRHLCVAHTIQSILIEFKNSFPVKMSLNCY